MSNTLTHLDDQGRANMVDVSDKASTRREATAQAWVQMRPETLQMIQANGHPKGDVFAVARIAEQARERWPLLGVEIVHRVGALSVSEPIVFVGVSNKHRHVAFEACAFIMDVLKTRAPFWKRETTTNGTHWVEARDSDQNAALRWSLAHA